MNTVPYTSAQVFQSKKRLADAIVFIHTHGEAVSKALVESNDPACKTALADLNKVRTAKTL